MIAEVPLVCVSWWWLVGAAWLGALFGAFLISLFAVNRQS
jgi:hypothetical protein